MAEGSESSSDESLDAKSAKFDALKALYSSKTNIPVPGAPTYDNLSKYEAVTMGLSRILRPKTGDSSAADVDLPTRRFLPHQQPVAGKGRGRRFRHKDTDSFDDNKNVISNMQNVLGPLELLHRCMQQRTRIKVYTRNEKDVRGYVEAYVAAFDKHWNLALEDCFEVWTRKVKRKAPALGSPCAINSGTNESCKTVVTKSNGKMETLERHIPQLLLRGEQVAIIITHNPMDHMNASGGHGAHGHTMDADHSIHAVHSMGSDHAMDADHSMHAQHSMDADHMNHNSMGGMDHGSSGGGSCSGQMAHGMSMAFHGGYCETVLFDSWKISSVGGLVGSMIGIVIMAALYEGLKYYREYLFWRTYNALQYRSVSMPQEKNVVAEDNRVVHMVGEVIHKQPPTMLSWMHSFQTFLHIVQIILSYFLMLIFMTYNVWLCFAVVLGAAIGYFLFGWKKSVIVDVTEHCH